MVKKKDNDDIWQPHPFNYTPYFKWLIKKREENYNRSALRIMRRLRQFKSEQYDNELYLDLYLVKYDKRDGLIMSDMQRHLEGKPNAFFIDDIELMKLLD